MVSSWVKDSAFPFCGHWWLHFSVHPSSLKEASEGRQPPQQLGPPWSGLWVGAGRRSGGRRGRASSGPTPTSSLPWRGRLEIWLRKLWKGDFYPVHWAIFPPWSSLDSKPWSLNPAKDTTLMLEKQQSMEDKRAIFGIKSLGLVLVLYVR